MATASGAVLIPHLTWRAAPMARIRTAWVVAIVAVALLALPGQAQLTRIADVSLAAATPVCRDPATGYLYVGTDSSPARVAKIDPGTGSIAPAVVSTLSISSTTGPTNLRACKYGGTWEVRARYVILLRLIQVSVLLYRTGTVSGGFVFFSGTNGRVAKIQMTSGTSAPVLQTESSSVGSTVALQRYLLYI